MVLVKTPSFQRTAGEAPHPGMLDTPTARRGRLHGLPGQASKTILTHTFPAIRVLISQWDHV